MPRTPRVPCSLGLDSTLRVSEAVSEAGGGSLCARELQFVRIMCTKRRWHRPPCTARAGAPGGAGPLAVALWLFESLLYFLYMSRNPPGSGPGLAPRVFIKKWVCIL